MIHTWALLGNAYLGQQSPPRLCIGRMLKWWARSPTYESEAKLMMFRAIFYLFSFDLYFRFKKPACQILFVRVSSSLFQWRGSLWILNLPILVITLPGLIWLWKYMLRSPETRMNLWLELPRDQSYLGIVNAQWSTSTNQGGWRLNQHLMLL